MKSGKWDWLDWNWRDWVAQFLPIIIGVTAMLIAGVLTHYYEKTAPQCSCEVWQSGVIIDHILNIQQCGTSWQGTVPDGRMVRYTGIYFKCGPANLPSRWELKNLTPCQIHDG